MTRVRLRRPPVSPVRSGPLRSRLFPVGLGPSGSGFGPSAHRRRRDDSDVTRCHHLSSDASRCRSRVIPRAQGRSRGNSVPTAIGSRSSSIRGRCHELQWGVILRRGRMQSGRRHDEGACSTARSKRREARGELEPPHLRASERHRIASTVLLLCFERPISRLSVSFGSREKRGASTWPRSSDRGDARLWVWNRRTGSSDLVHRCSMHPRWAAQWSRYVNLLFISLEKVFTTWRMSRAVSARHRGSAADETSLQRFRTDRTANEPVVDRFPPGGFGACETACATLRSVASNPRLGDVCGPRSDHPKGGAPKSSKGL